MRTDPAPVTIALKKPLVTPRGLVTRLTIRKPTHEDCDAMEIASSAVIDGVFVPVGQAAPNLIELVGVLALLGSMNDLDPADLTRLSEDDLATVAEELDRTLRAGINDLKGAR